MPPGTSSRKVYWFVMTGTLTAGVWSAIVGLSAASVIGGNQTAAGVRGEVGGGAAGDLALVAIMLGAILSACANAYSSSLAFQAAGLAVKRPILTVGISGAALGLVLWMQTGSVSAHFEEVLLLADYWIAAFVPIVIIDWLRRHREYTADRLAEAMPLHKLPPGWPALVAFVAGFGVMIPFMDTTVYEGPVATALKGGPGRCGRAYRPNTAHTPRCPELRVAVILAARQSSSPVPRRCGSPHACQVGQRQAASLATVQGSGRFTETPREA